MKQQKSDNNALVVATKNGNFINLTLYVGDLDVSIKVNDFGGKRAKQAKALTYKLYKALNEK